MRRFTYAVELNRRNVDGLYLALCSDIHEAIAIGTTAQEALVEVARELEFAIVKRIVYGHEIPRPSRRKSETPMVAIPHSLARLASQYLKAARGRHLRRKSFLMSQIQERIDTLVAQRTGSGFPAPRPFAGRSPPLSDHRSTIP